MEAEGDKRRRGGDDDGPSRDLAIGYLSERGYSDSIVPSCQFTAAKQVRIVQHVGRRSTPPPDERAKDQTTPFVVQPKPKHDLHLPSFQSLGISSLHPLALLTPPDDSERTHIGTSSGTSAPRHALSPMDNITPTPPDMNLGDITPTTTVDQSHSGTATWASQAIQTASKCDHMWFL